MIRHKTVSLDPYRCDVLLLAGGTWRQAHDLLTKRGFSDLPDRTKDCDGCTLFDKDGTPSVVWVYGRTVAGTVAHEAMHAVYALMSVRGITLSDDSDEAYAYLIQQLVNATVDKKGWQ